MVRQWTSLSMCLVRAAGSDSYKATLFGGSLSKSCLLLMQKVALSQLEKLTQAIHRESARQLQTQQQQKISRVAGEAVPLDNI